VTSPVPSPHRCHASSGNGRHAADLRDVHHHAADVDGHDAGDPRRPGNRRRKRAAAEEIDLPLRVPQVEMQRDRIDVDEDGDRAAISNHLGGGGEGHRGNEHGFASGQADGLDREMEGGRAGVQRDRMPGADRFRELLLETADPGPGRQPAGAERRDDFGDLGVGDLRAMEGNRELHESSSSVPAAGARRRYHRFQNRANPERNPSP
jgi:hypothetical protein